MGNLTFEHTVHTLSGGGENFSMLSFLSQSSSVLFFSFLSITVFLLSSLSQVSCSVAVSGSGRAPPPALTPTPAHTQALAQTRTLTQARAQPQDPALTRTPTWALARTLDCVQLMQMFPHSSTVFIWVLRRCSFMIS